MAAETPLEQARSELSAQADHQDSLGNDYMDCVKVAHVRALLAASTPEPARLSAPAPCDCSWTEDIADVPCGCGQENARLYRDAVWHYNGKHWRADCLIRALAAPPQGTDNGR